MSSVFTGSIFDRGARTLAVVSMLKLGGVRLRRLRYTAQQNPPLTIGAIAYGLARIRALALGEAAAADDSDLA